MKPLKERIREILNKVSYLGGAHRGNDDGIDHSLQAILDEIRENLPKKKNRKVISATDEIITEEYYWSNEQIAGYNLYHDEMRKLLE